MTETTQYGSYNPVDIEAMKQKAIEQTETRRPSACPYRNFEPCWEADCQMWDKFWKDCGLKTAYGK